MANVQELYDRFKGGGGGAKMVYPLENQSDYLGKITFTPVVETGIEVPNLNLLDLEEGALGKAVDFLKDTSISAKALVKNYIVGGEESTDGGGSSQDNTVKSALETEGRKTENAGFFWYWVWPDQQ